MIICLRVVSVSHVTFVFIRGKIEAEHVSGCKKLESSQCNEKEHRTYLSLNQQQQQRNLFKRIHES